MGAPFSGRRLESFSCLSGITVGGFPLNFEVEATSIRGVPFHELQVNLLSLCCGFPVRVLFEGEEDVLYPLICGRCRTVPAEFADSSVSFQELLDYNSYNILSQTFLRHLAFLQGSVGKKRWFGLAPARPRGVILELGAKPEIGRREVAKLAEKLVGHVLDLTPWDTAIESARLAVALEESLTAVAKVLELREVSLRTRANRRAARAGFTVSYTGEGVPCL